MGGGGGGNQLGFDGGTDSGRALARAAAPVPLEGGAFDDEGGGAAVDATGMPGAVADLDDGGAEGAGGTLLAKAMVARCAPLLARAGTGAALPGGSGAFTPARAAEFAAAIFGSDAGRPAASAAAIDSLLAAAIRVESMRTAAICVEPSVESE